MLAGLDRRQCHLHVHVVGEQHLEGIDRVIGKAFPPVGVDLLRLDAPTACPCQRALGIGLADRGDLGVRRVHILDGVQVADAAWADDGHPQAFDGCGHVFSLPWLMMTTLRDSPYSFTDPMVRPAMK